MRSILSRSIGIGTALLIAVILVRPFAGSLAPDPFPAASRRSASEAASSVVATSTAQRSAWPDQATGASRAAPGPPLRGVSVLTLEFSGLQPLSAGHYEGWAVFATDRVSTGKFVVGSDARLRSPAGAPIVAFPVTRDIAAAERIEVTIEPDGDRDGAPSGVTILAGPLRGGRAALAFPADVTTVRGGFALITPTDRDAANDAGGAWFYDPTTAAPGLALPELPAGWVFEGWVGTQGFTFSTGRFRQAVGPDGAAPYSGPLRGPSAPGEDLLARLPAAVQPPVDLRDGTSTIAVSVEPDIRGRDPTGAGPFWLLLLHSRIAPDWPTGRLLPLGADTSLLPSGVATVG